MNTKLLRKFKMRYQIVGYRNKWVLLDLKLICVVDEIYKHGDENISTLIDFALRELLGDNKFRKLRNKWFFNRCIRYDRALKIKKSNG